MAARRRRKKKKGWFRIVLLFVLTPLVVWSVAFFTWLYWADIRDVVGMDGARTTARPAPRPSEEKILEEDRRKLDEILRKGKR